MAVSTEILESTVLPSNSFHSLVEILSIPHMVDDRDIPPENNTPPSANPPRKMDAWIKMDRVGDRLDSGLGGVSMMNRGNA